MQRVLGRLAVATLVVAASAAKADPAKDARQLGSIFCRVGSEFGRMYLLTRSLTAAINDAVKKNNEIAGAKPDEKPPLGDGIPFQSYPDDAPVCKPGKLADKGRNQELEIVYEFPDAKGNWTDRLVLIVEDGRPRIDDVLFGTDDSGNGLRKALTTVLDN